MEVHWAQIVSIAVLLSFQGRCIFSQTLTGPTAVVDGGNAEFTCSVPIGNTVPIFWLDSSKNIFIGDTPATTVSKYDNFGVSVGAESSTLTVTGAEIGADGDDGVYACQVNAVSSNALALVVEVASTTRTLTVSPSCVAGSTCTAQCDALGAKPKETITWSMSGTTEETNPANADPYLNNTISVLTFTPTSADDTQQLTCSIGGHALTALNGNVMETLNVLFSPVDDAIVVTFDKDSRDVTCTVVDQANGKKSANPSINNFWLYQDNELIPGSTGSSNTVKISEVPMNITTFMCVAGNYLGNATHSVEFDPEGTTTPPTTTGTTPEDTTEGSTKAPRSGAPPTTTPVAGGNDTRTGNSKAAGIAAGVCCALFAIILVITCACLKQQGKLERCGLPAKGGCTCGGSSDDKNSSHNKVSVTEKLEQQAPRKIEHTTDNAGGDEYAMVSKPPAARGNSGDYPDGGQNGKGQTDPGMHYADIDLSKDAGHTEARVPQNQNDVVVYSSILV